MLLHFTPIIFHVNLPALDSMHRLYIFYFTAAGLTDLAVILESVKFVVSASG